MLVAVLLFLLINGFTDVEATVCRVDAECGTGQCCYIEPEFQIVSRRRDNQPIVLPQSRVQHDTGVCEDFKTQHTPCSPLERLNGHCGCGPGLTCQFVPEATTVSSGKRKIWLPGPGRYQCEPTTP